MKLDDVDLAFEEAAIEAIAEKALERKTGARGIRSIVESTLIEIMYDLPSMKGPKKVIITRDVIINDSMPVLITDPDKLEEPWENALYENKQITA